MLDGRLLQSQILSRLLSRLLQSRMLSHIPSRLISLFHMYLTFQIVILILSVAV
jgi:hypothetical protein